MSKLESRAEEIRSRAAEIGWSIRWYRIRSRLYVEVDTSQGHPFNGNTTTVKLWLQSWYPNPEVTSVIYGRLRYMVFDLLRELRREDGNDGGG